MAQTKYIAPLSTTGALLGWRSFSMMDLDFVRTFDGVKDFISMTATTSTQALDFINDYIRMGWIIENITVFD